MCLQGVTDSPLPLFVLVGLFVDLDDLPLGVLLRPEDVGVGRGTHPAIKTFVSNCNFLAQICSEINRELYLLPCRRAWRRPRGLP